MIEIRKGIFETNSSSVHALVIPKDQQIVIPNIIHLKGGQFGWEYEKEYDTINYLYEACRYRGEDEVAKLIAFLEKHNIEVIVNERHGYTYVDHGDEIPFDDLFNNEQLLERFLFGTDSYVQLGNDNNRDKNPKYNEFDSNLYDVLIKGN